MRRLPEDLASTTDGLGVQFDSQPDWLSWRGEANERGTRAAEFEFCGSAAMQRRKETRPVRGRLPDRWSKRIGLVTSLAGPAPSHDRPQLIADGWAGR
jgi:hypothetical protein